MLQARIIIVAREAGAPATRFCVVNGKPVAAERATKGADRILLKGKVAGGLERSDRIK
jgi:hypothetical protein